MELFLQMGHGMMRLAENLIEKWGSGNVIISPVNLCQAQIQSFSKKILKRGGKVLFDPQMFYPKAAHEKLTQYDYWPAEGVSVTSSDGFRQINQELLRINNEIGSEEIILPSKEINENEFNYAIEWHNRSVDYFRSKTTKPLLATLCLYPETLRDRAALEVLVNALDDLPVDGYYIVPHPSNGEYIVSDPLWTIGILKLVTCLKLSGNRVVVGYSSHQGLLYSLAHVDAIASGTFMNTRSFQPSKFRSPRDTDVKHKSTWYYLPEAMSEYKAPSLDVALSRGFLQEFIPQDAFRNPFSDMLFQGALPSNTNYNETNSFLHYLHCLRVQCEMLTQANYDNAFSMYELLLSTAEQKIERISRRGISGQNRDFSPAIEANRVAMCANDEDYGFRLKMEWSNL